MSQRAIWLWLCALPCAALVTLAIATHLQIKPVPEMLNIAGSAIEKPQLLDRHLAPITITYKNHWNIHNSVVLHEIPLFLQQAFIAAEDKRFYQHAGTDWLARAHALWQNLAAIRNVRGASTISEQTIKMLHPRPRSLWTRWLEGIEATQLEKHFSKNDILQFYLNQVPYSAQRRGVVQAAHYYFGRDLDTLNQQEMLTLAVLVRAPSRLDPIKHTQAASPAIGRLAETMKLPAPGTAGSPIIDDNLQSVRASHYAKFVYHQTKQSMRTIHTTLDLNLQNAAQALLEKRLHELRNRNVKNGAVLIVDNRSNEILSWAVAGDGNPEFPGSGIDAVTTPRQPGSTLKPLLYAMALENGFTAATLIDDSPLSESVGTGMHTYHNYSRRHYGPVSLREALGNSLNIPAIKTLQKTGTGKFLHTLHALGINNLQQHPDIYGDGLALGNGEITLYELVQAYSTLAAHGQFRPLVTTRESISGWTEKSANRIFTKESSSLIANILSDKNARKLEFGTGSLLDLPIQTAVKTGTSNDYRDAWTVGFNHRYTVGVWMGNMDRQAMKKVTGSSGPARVFRSVFSVLNKHKRSRPLYLSPQLIKADICKETGLSVTNMDTCTLVNEWFIEKPELSDNKNAKQPNQTIRIQQPSPNLQMAMDPRIPDDKEYFRFSLNQQTAVQNVKWLLDGRLLAETTVGHIQWRLEKGTHRLRAEISSIDQITETDTVIFLVK
ncbi:MAG: transglycosylase domain-containing protein [Granulosicoccus sp.]